MTRKANNRHAKYDSDEKRILEMIAGIHRSLAVITAILLLLGQLTIVGVFVTPRGFRVSIAGPITGFSRIESKTGSPIVNAVIDVISFGIAGLLLKDSFQVTGSVLTARGFTVNVGGPLLGLPRLYPKIPNWFTDLDNFNEVVARIFHLNPDIAGKYNRRSE
ncbi:hypothetical protein SAMN05421736_12319 [Evansella caseinilytica]|uniref:Uncharacterized protein n=1 Tax=Evansella caseinilytica TaxID=1503961 RepID=A0A1H3ULW2_9BACI|nr:hypothetical protein [Evansella caseinilytica]SDZ63286.1 hypothetical protein SAMN05421736_12319 [Evansella caseinilytica]